MSCTDPVWQHHFTVILNELLKVVTAKLPDDETASLNISCHYAMNPKEDSEWSFVHHPAMHIRLRAILYGFFDLIPTTAFTSK